MHISFSEILVVLLVAVLVIKPERVPEVARTLGRWVKGFKQMVFEIKGIEKSELGRYSYRKDKE